MQRKVFAFLAASVIAASMMAHAQTNQKLADLIPLLYGDHGLELKPTCTAGSPGCNEHEHHFSNAVLSQLGPFTTAMTSQLATLKFPSPASGFTFRYDPATGLQTISENSLGPIFGDRADTIGRNRFTLGFSFQHFRFDTINGLDLNNVPIMYSHVKDTGLAFERDEIFTTNNIRASVNQFALYGTYGITNRLEASIAVPIVRMSLSAVSTATIIRIGGDAQTHSFPGGNPDTEQFSSSGTKTGLGDITLRVKGEAVRWESSGLSFGLDARLPTGDAENLLGSGAVGIRPFAVYSTRLGPLSPHVNVGYEWNGKSKVASPMVIGEDNEILPPNTKSKLPDQFVYAVGTELKLPKRVTLAFDLLGRQFRNAQTLVLQPFVAANGQAYPSVSFVKSSFWTEDGAAGIKIPFGRFLVMASAIFSLDNNGLRSKVVPLFGIQYNH